LVLFGDVVRSRDDLQGSTRWLRTLTEELERAYAPAERLAPIAFTQGDELQALLGVTADPFVAVLLASLHPEALEMRWVIAAGAVEPGRGPTTERTGEAFLAARALSDAARARRERLLVAVGAEPADTLLAELAPLLAGLLGDLTDRQREIARLMLVEGLRQSTVAERLGVSRATISVMAERARIRRLQGLVAALRLIVAGALTPTGDAS
jgi:DNA-binding NarL/FixJ family response regulator